MRKRPEPASVLLDREPERAALDDLLGDLRAGRGRALMLRGEAGVGKSALLDYVARAPDVRMLRAVSVESEMELAFAGLHLLCMPLLDRMESLPSPQRDALAVAFGLREGGAPDRFLVGLAVLTLLAEAAEERPLLCLVDDAQWLDQESAQVLAFAAQRLLAEPVGLVFAAREPGEQFRGLAELEVDGLPDRAARALLGSVVPFELDERVRDRILAETRGNPLALLELPRGLGPVQLAGEFGLIGALAVPARVERGFLRRLAALPADTRSLMLLAAAEPTSDPLLLWRAASLLGVPSAAAGAAQDDGLLRIDTRVRFRHPLVRSAVYSSASMPESRAAHLALAKVTDRDRDPDRRAWHLAAAAPGPDEAVAAELERSAGRAQARGGMAAAAAFLQRAAELTSEPAVRSERALAAAEASLQAGALAAAGELLAMAGPGDKLQQARAALVRGRLVFASGGGSDAPALLLKAARQFESLDPAQARRTYLDAWYAAVYAGRFAGAGSLDEVSQAARAAPPPEGEPRAPDLLAAEEEALSAATGVRFVPRATLFLAGFRGNEAEAAPAIRAVAAASQAAGLGVGVQMSQRVSAVLYNGLGCHEKALTQAEKAAEQAPALYIAMWALPELIEAASWTGQTQLAADALVRLGDATSIAQTDWGAGYLRTVPGAAQRRPGRREVVPRGNHPAGPHRLPVRTGPGPPPVWRVAGPCGPSGRRGGAAGHGVWNVRRHRHAGVRRAGPSRVAGRRNDGTQARRGHPRRAHPQEAQIARLARDSMSNREIAAQLFLSPHTMEYHLAKVFTKLGISSRRQLPQALLDSERVRPTA